MLFGEAEDLLLGWVTEQPAKIFKTMSDALERFAAGGIDRACRMPLDQSTQSHNRAQRFSSTGVESRLSPLAALIPQDRCSANPIAAGTKHRSVQATGAQSAAELTRLDAGMDLDLFHPLVEDPYAATIPAHPDLLTNQFGGYFVKGTCDFDVTVTMDIAPGFLVTRKKRFR